MTSQGGSLAGNTLHSTAITEEAICVVVEELIAGLVEGCTGLGLGNGESNGVGETLTQGAGGDLNTRGVVSLRVTGGFAVELLNCVSMILPDGGLLGRGGTNAEVLQVIHGKVIAKEMQQSILKHAPVTVGQNETVPVHPVRVLGVEGHELVEKHMGHGSHAHGGTGVPRVGLEGGIDLHRSISIRQAGNLGCRRRGVHTARVRMVLMANWSMSEYGMMAL